MAAEVVVSDRQLLAPPSAKAAEFRLLVCVLLESPVLKTQAKVAQGKDARHGSPCRCARLPKKKLLSKRDDVLTIYYFCVSLNYPYWLQKFVAIQFRQYFFED